MIRVSRVTKRSKACKRIQEINGKNKGMGDCGHTGLRPAIAGAKDITTLEELGMGSNEVVYECECGWWLGESALSRALIERKHLPCSRT